MAAFANTMQGLLTLVVTKSLHLATMCIYQVLYTVCGVFGPWIMKRGDPTSKNIVRLWRSGPFDIEALVEGELSDES